MLQMEFLMPLWPRYIKYGFYQRLGLWPTSCFERRPYFFFKCHIHKSILNILFPVTPPLAWWLVIHQAEAGQRRKAAKGIFFSAAHLGRTDPRVSVSYITEIIYIYTSNIVSIFGSLSCTMATLLVLSFSSTSCCLKFVLRHRTALHKCANWTLQRFCTTGLKWITSIFGYSVRTDFRVYFGGHTTHNWSCKVVFEKCNKKKIKKKD